MALARLFLGLWFFLAIGHTSGGYFGLRGTLLLLYFLYSLTVILALQFRPASSSFFHIGIHGLDILWAAYLSLLVNWPAVSVVLFFFLLMSSKMRWGFWEAQLTTVSFILLSLFGAWVRQPHLPLGHTMSFEQGMTFLLFCLLSLVTGFLSEAKVLRLENTSIAGLIESIRLDGGFQNALQSVCDAGIRLFRATQVLVAIHERDRNRASLFRATNANPVIQSSELSPGEWDQYFFPAPAESWRMGNTRRAGPLQFECLTLDSGKTKSCATNI
jgi:hypothetical protein